MILDSKKFRNLDGKLGYKLETGTIGVSVGDRNIADIIKGSMYAEVMEGQYGKYIRVLDNDPTDLSSLLS